MNPFYKSFINGRIFNVAKGVKTKMNLSYAITPLLTFCMLNPNIVFMYEGPYIMKV